MCHYMQAAITPSAATSAPAVSKDVEERLKVDEQPPFAKDGKVCTRVCV